MTPNTPSRSGSEQRRRTELVALRLLPEERARLADEAHARGSTVAALLRDRALPTPHTTSGSSGDDVAQQPGAPAHPETNTMTTNEHDDETSDEIDRDSSARSMSTPSSEPEFRLRSLRELLETYEEWGARNSLHRSRRQAEERGDHDGAAALQHILDRHHPSETTALDALAAQHELAEQLAGVRYITTCAAREAGASWRAIGRAMNYTEPGEARQQYLAAVQRRIDAAASYGMDFEGERYVAAAGDWWDELSHYTPPEVVEQIEQAVAHDDTTTLDRLRDTWWDPSRRPDQADTTTDTDGAGDGRAAPPDPWALDRREPTEVETALDAARQELEAADRDGRPAVELVERVEDLEALAELAPHGGRKRALWEAAKVDPGDSGPLTLEELREGLARFNDELTGYGLDAVPPPESDDVDAWESAYYDAVHDLKAYEHHRDYPPMTRDDWIESDYDEVLASTGSTAAADSYIQVKYRAHPDGSDIVPDVAPEPADAVHDTTDTTDTTDTGWGHDDRVLSGHLRDEAALGLPPEARQVPARERPVEQLTDAELLTRAEQCDNVTYLGDYDQFAEAHLELDALRDEAVTRAEHSDAPGAVALASYVELLCEDPGVERFAEFTDLHRSVHHALGVDPAPPLGAGHEPAQDRQLRGPVQGRAQGPAQGPVQRSPARPRTRHGSSESPR